MGKGEPRGGDAGIEHGGAVEAPMGHFASRGCAGRFAQRLLRDVTMNSTSILRRLGAVCALGLSVMAAPLLTPGAFAAENNAAKSQSAEAKAAASKEAPKTQDHLILSKNGGMVVKGQIVEETASSVTMMVEFPGMPAVKTTYQKSDIVEIKRDQPAEASASIAPKAADKDKKKDDPFKDKVAPTATAEDDAAKIMVVNLEGRLGWDYSVTPMVEVFEAVDKEFNDLDSSGNVRDEMRQKNIVVFKIKSETSPRQGFDGFFAAEKFAPVFEKQFEKGRRIVFWVEEALGGAGFLPMLSPESYWKSDGIVKGAGNDLDKFDLGDKMVNEKQISLRLGHAEGIPIKGGYGEVGVAVVRALARQSNWLVVRMEGGKPVVLEREPTKDDYAEHPNWIILKDNGQGQYKDKMKTEGNDQLELKAEWARNLGLSKGTCDTVEDLAFAFGVQRNWKEIEKPKAQEVLERRKEDVKRAFELINPRPTQEVDMGRLWRDLEEIRDGQTYEEQRRAQGRRIQTLQQIQGVMTKYKEIFDPEGQQVAQLSVRIEGIKQEMDLARKAFQRAQEGQR